MHVFHRREAAADRHEASALPEDEDLDWRSYDRVASEYARVQAPALAAPGRDLVALLEIPPGGRVLDVGTGTGVAARAAAEAAGERGVVVGVDASVPMLRVADRADGPDGSNRADGAVRVRYAAAAAIDLPFGDGTFGHELASFVLSHFANLDTAAYEMLRVLVPGGRLGVTTWAASDETDELHATWRSVVEEFAEHEVVADATMRGLPQEERLGRPETLKQTLHDAGLRDIRIEQRTYRREMSREDYLAGREITASGRFLHEMLGEALWASFVGRAREVFSERFPERLNDFRDVLLAVGHKP